jgi:hypothetical protein
MSDPLHPQRTEGSSSPRLYVVPASPLEVDDGRESIASAILRRWRRAVLGLVVGGAFGLLAVWSTEGRLVYTSALDLGRTVAIANGRIAIEPVQDAAAARESILERLRAASPEDLSPLARGVELTPASGTGRPSNALWLRLRTSEPLDAVAQAFGQVAAIAALAQSEDFASALERQTSAIDVAESSSERATFILDRIRDGQAESPVNLPDLIRLAGEAKLLRDAASDSQPARLAGPILVAPQPAPEARAAVTVALPALLLGFLACTPWRRRATAR